jgi:Type III restriction enzyme, res subunit
MEEQKYVYVMDNDLFSVDNVRKYGYTTNPHQRLTEADTQLPRPHRYEYLWRIDFVPEHCKSISVHDKVITTTLNTQQHIYKINKFECGGGTEFFQGEPLEIKRILTDQGYVLKDITLDDIEKQNKEAMMSPKKLPIKDVLGLVDDIETDTKVETISTNKDQKWQARDYQQEAIEYSSTKMKEDKRIYIELATGGGKSYIVFNIFKKIKSRIIFILSPRKIVNKQNVKSSYVKILDGSTHVYDLTDDKNKSFEKFCNKDGNKIVVACVQSFDKVFKYIVDYDMRDVSIWFDEAHWGLENWLTADAHDSKKLLLEDTTRISHRIFTSASPDRDVIKSNKAIFGELYRPIKVSELMEEGWLCPINPFVFCEDKEGVNVLDYMLNHFKEHNKSWGFSFHHNQKSAASLFKIHLKMYNEGLTNIKPFLLISDNIIFEDLETVNDFFEYNDAKHTDLHTFEATQNSIAYVVAKYSMGYDFKEIDNICFSDYKMSPKDIIQSIGRGTRPDCIGLDGRNKNKKLDVLLPVFPDSDDIDKYYRIAEVLVYLVGEVEIPLDKIVFTQGIRQGNSKSIYVETVDYDKVESVRSKVFDATRFILNREKKITYNYIKELNKKLYLHSRDDYLQSEERHQCFIKDPETTFKQEWISWYDFIGLNTSTYLQTKEEFISYCKNNDITSCDEYNKHYSLNKNKTLPQDPFQMYPNFTNWNDELKGEDDFIW